VANLRFRLTIISVGLVLIALALGWFAPKMIAMLPEQVTAVHLLAVSFVFVGLCGVAFYSLMERALNPVMRLIDTFTRMRAGDLNPRLPVEGPEEMRRMARGFYDMVEDLETQIRDIEVEKQSAERDRQLLDDQVSDTLRFQWAIDAAPVGVVVTNANLEIVYQNPASTSGFLQLEASENLDRKILGEPLASLYPDDMDVNAILSDPDRMPFENDVVVGPHRLHFLANATFDEDEEFAGVVLIWEEVERLSEDDPEFDESLVESLDETEVFDFNEDLEPVDPEAGIDEDVLAEVEELESADQSFEMIEEDDSVEDEATRGQNGMHVSDRPASSDVQRTALLVQRSVGVLLDRLEGVTSTVDALCDEGDSLRRAIEDIKDQAERTDRLVDERSEPLHDLIEDRRRVTSRREEAASLAVSLKTHLSDATDLDRSMDRLRGSIEHLVASSRVELSKLDGETGGLEVVVDAIGDLGEEARRLSESTHTCFRELSERVDGVISIVKDGADTAGLEEQLDTRAEISLSRMGDARAEGLQRNDLLKEMASGQAEIAQHIAKQIKELADLVALTAKVAAEQVETVEGPTRIG
jgi:methyl-accepting chemotaxis protein